MSRRRCKRQFIKFAQHVHRLITGTLNSENEDEEQDKATEHRCPEDPERLHSQSCFTKEELQILYRGFKTGCPSGIVSEDAFKSIYAQFFPGGDSSKYAHFIFNAFDTDQNGSITFEKYARGLSVLLRGSTDEKLYWAFNLYDLNKDGYISKEEMLDIMKAIYDLRGDSIPPSLKEEASRQHVDIFFQKMDRNQDGVVTVDEFIDACQKDDNIMHSIQLFESAI